MFRLKKAIDVKNNRNKSLYNLVYLKLPEASHELPSSVRSTLKSKDLSKTVRDPRNLITPFDWTSIVFAISAESKERLFDILYSYIINK